MRAMQLATAMAMALVLAVACVRRIVPDPVPDDDEDARRARARSAHDAEVRRSRAELAPLVEAARAAGETTAQVRYLWIEEARTAAHRARLEPPPSPIAPPPSMPAPPRPPGAPADRARELKLLDDRRLASAGSLATLAAEQERRERTVDRLLASARAAIAARGDGASLVPAARLACLELDTELRRRVGSLHTEVPALVDDPRCAGDPITGGAIHDHCAAAVDEDWAAAAAHLATIDAQLACASARQVELLDGALVAATEAVAGRVGDGRIALRRAALRSLLLQIEAGPILLVGERMRPFAAPGKLSLQWFRWHRATLRAAAWRTGSALEQLGLPVVDQVRARLGVVTSRCIPSDGRVFGGDARERFVKFAGAGGAETCNPLGAMIDSMDLPCPSTDWIPAGTSARLAEAFTCAPACGRGGAADTPREVVDRQLAAGAGLRTIDSLAARDPAVTGAADCPSAAGDRGGEDGLASIQTLGDVAAECAGPAELLPATEEVSACVFAATHPEPLTYRSQRTTPRGPSGGPGCAVADGGDGGDGAAAPPESAAEREAREQRERELAAGRALAEQRMVKAQDDGFSYRTYVQDLFGRGTGTWAVFQKVDASGTHARDINVDTGEERRFTNGKEEEPGLPYRIAVTHVDDDGVVDYSYFERGRHVNGTKVVEQREVSIDRARLRRMRSCAPETPDCGSCTVTDLAAAAVNECLGVERPGRGDDRTGAPPGWDRDLGPLVNIQPDVNPELFERMIARTRVCAGSGLEREVCPGESVALCPEEQPRCTCGPGDAGPAPDGPRVDCERVRCDPGLAAATEGGTCRCGGVVGSPPGGDRPDPR